MSGNMNKTSLHAWHAEHGGRLVDFAGWEMPVQYTSITEEHHATRKAVALFDVSHMGRFQFQGPAAGALLDRLVTRRVADLQPGRICYALVTNEQGGILDDVLVYRLSDVQQLAFQLVVNAGNRDKIAAWIHAHLEDSAVEFHDATLDTAMIAVQGPRALEVIAALVDFDPQKLKYYRGQAGQILGHSCLVSRTGYTGEDGCELIVPAEQAVEVWQAILDQGQPAGAQPAGLGCRDTLRLEAAMPLYGHELSEAINPLQAGLGFAVDLDKEFIGREALAAIASEKQPVRVGLELASRRVPREHYAICADGQPVGEVTSGTFSPTLERPIAMGYVSPEYAKPGTALTVDIRGRAEPASVVLLPFYSRSK